MSGSISFACSTSVQQLTSDKIFQFYYQKHFKSRDYSEFFHISDKEKVNFLADLYLFVSKKGGFIYDEIGSKNNKSKKELINKTAEFSNTLNKTPSYLSILPKDLTEKLNEIKDEKKKKEILNKMNKFNLNEKYDQKEENELHVSESKKSLALILKKYNNPPKLNLTTDVNTIELQSLILNIENCIHKNDDLDNYIKEDYDNENDDHNNGRIHSSTINRNLDEINDDLYDKLNDVYAHIQIPTYQSTFYKADYNKSKKICMEEINEVNSEYYLVDNREIFVMENNNVDEWIKSNNNGLTDTKSSGYKKLTNPNKKCEVNSLSNVLFNKISSNIFVNTLSKKNLIKGDAMLLGYLNSKNRKILFEDLILINEIITETTEANIDKSKCKGYIGRDLIDRIYFCPMNNVIVLDYNEANKLGVMLLDYLRIEADRENLKRELEYEINERHFKYEEEARRYEDEKQKFVDEINYLKERDQKKLEMVYEYINNLRNKLEFTQRMINESPVSGEMDNSKIIEAINKNLENLTKTSANNENDFFEHSTAVIDKTENPSYEDIHNNSIKSADFFFRKKGNSTMISSSHINLHNQSQLSQIASRSAKYSSPK